MTTVFGLLTSKVREGTEVCKVRVGYDLNCDASFGVNYTTIFILILHANRLVLEFVICI